MESTESQSNQIRRIRLFLLSNQSLFRASLGSLLALEPGFELAGESPIDSGSIGILERSEADVALVEFGPDTPRGVELMAAAARSRYPGRLFIITEMLDARSSARALKLGVSGIFLKSDSAERLVHAIRAVASGEMWIDPRVIRTMADRFPMEEGPIRTETLTDREHKVLSGILGGLSNRKIGEDLNLSESSIKAVVQHLFDKTGVRTRSQLVRVAITRFPHAVADLRESRVWI